MAQSRVRAGLSSLVLAALFAAILTATGQRPASAAVTAVSGSATGFQTEVSLFGGPEGYRGATVIPSPEVGGNSGPHGGTGQYPCTSEGGDIFNPADVPAGCTRSADFAASESPKVVLPSTGGNLSLTDANGARGQYGPALIFGGRQLNTPSGPMRVSTQGTTGPTGSATSNFDIFLDNATLFPGSETSNDGPGGLGPGPLEADEAHSTCTASQSGLTGSATFVNGVVSDGQGGFLASIPNSPAPNTRISGELEGIGDRFTIIFNEQLFETDGNPATQDITVNAAHMILEGPTAVGHMIVGQVHCDVAGSASGTTTVSPRSLETGQSFTASATGVPSPNAGYRLKISTQQANCGTGVLMGGSVVSTAESTIPTTVRVIPLTITPGTRWICWVSDEDTSVHTPPVEVTVF